jgi:hypothetical protein
MPKTRKHLKKRKKGRNNSIRGGACSTKPIVDTSGRAAISRTNHDDVLEGTLGPLGGMVGNLTFPHYNALAQTLSTVAENMVEDVMTEVLKEIEDNKIEGLICEAFERACYSTKWGSNPFIKDSTSLESIKASNTNSNPNASVDGTNESTKKQENEYNILKIYMKNLGNESAMDDMIMSFFSPEVFRYAISNMDLEAVADAKLLKDNSQLKANIIEKIKATTQKLTKPENMEQLKFEWVDKENFNRKPIPTANRKQSSFFIPRITIPLNFQLLFHNSQLPR